MTPEELASKIDGLVIEANGKLAKSIARVQDQLYAKLTATLKKLETDKDGFIRQSAANRRILLQAQSEFDFIITQETNYVSSIERYLKNVPGIDALNAAYFETVSSAFAPNRAFIKQLQSQTIKTVNDLLLKDGLSASVKLPLNEILNQNVNTGGSFSGMLEQLRMFIRGNSDLDGRLISYSRGILNDTLFQYARGYQQSVTADLGLSWYRYVGGLIKDSRPFCIKRAGNYYHESEIKAWASLSWQGRNRYTTESSIFIVAGGYNCNHQIIPVHESIVPADDRDRIAV